MLYPSRAPLVLRLPCIDRTLPFWVGQPHRPLRILLRGRRSSETLALARNNTTTHRICCRQVHRKREMYARRTRIFGNRDSLLLAILRSPVCASRVDVTNTATIGAHTTPRSQPQSPAKEHHDSKRPQTVTAENLDQRIRIRQPSQCIANRPRICATQAVAFTTPQQLRSLSNLQWHGPVDNRDELLGVGQHSGTHVNRSTHLLAKYLIRNLEVIGNGNIDRPPRDGNGRTPCASGCRNRVCNESTPQQYPRSESSVHQPLLRTTQPRLQVCKPSHSPSHNGCKSVTQTTTTTEANRRRKRESSTQGSTTLKCETPALSSQPWVRDTSNAPTSRPETAFQPRNHQQGEHNPDLPTDNWETSTGSCARGTLACATIQKSPFALSLRQLPPSMHSKATAHALEVHDTGSTLIDPKPPPSSTSIARLQITQRCQYGWR
ncbi:hypothetical protein D9611_014958 [Ephemerocybe angulata]|uniref:Uncharacterized protein n=1 Tax=Ephemerocybe angulata TaxID=980116 RepID=A0A8H5C2N3_9AGAR|nr:hypothetical protein D9611_014958 [Tulosesus angulatus]